MGFRIGDLVRTKEARDSRRFWSKASDRFWDFFGKEGRVAGSQVADGEHLLIVVHLEGWNWSFRPSELELVESDIPSNSIGIGDTVWTVFQPDTREFWKDRPEEFFQHFNRTGTVVDYSTESKLAWVLFAAEKVVWVFRHSELARVRRGEGEGGTR